MDQREVMALLEQMVEAINDHDLPRLVSCFHPDYQSVQPVHPERAFQGRDRVEVNWRWVFDQFPDFQAEIVDFAVRESTVWIEWVWQGSDSEGSIVSVRGVMIVTIEDGMWRLGRLFMEPME
jgi:ketosteroid isomerase-like protein